MSTRILALLFCFCTAAGLFRALAQAPAIVTQPPLTTTTSPGSSVTLSPVVSGTSLTYQWQLNGIAIPGKTQQNLTFNAITLGDAGSYSLVVRNGGGLSVTSRLSIVDVADTGAVISFSNGVLQQKVYDTDGTTPLAGDRYLAQLHAGPTANSLAPIGAAVPFNTGNIAGYWRGGTRNLASVVPGASAYAQVHVWETGRGRTFEEARSAGSKVGSSAVVFIPTTGGGGFPPGLPAVLTGLSAFNVAVALPPTILTQPAGTSVPLGSPIQLTVEATGGAPLRYQWQFNGANIPAATNAAYTLLSATPNHAGSYRVTISNSFGNITSSFAVVVVEEAGGSVQFSNTAARAVVTAEDGVTLLSGDGYLAQLYAGTSAANLVPVSGAVPFSSTVPGYWRGGVRNVPWIAPGAAAFVQARVWPTTAGNTFEAAVQQGAAVGLSAIIPVTLGGAGVPPSFPATMNNLLPFSLTRQIAPQINQPLAPLVVIAGQPLVLTVGATGLQPFTYAWTFGGIPIPGATGPTLNLGPAEPGDTGDYAVVVRNGHGEASSGPVRVTVVAPPSITRAPLPQAVTLGSPATFSVEAAGSAPLAYQWQLNTVDIPGANNPTFTQPSVQQSHAGQYTVRISNPGGSITSLPVRLDVIVPPAITTQPADTLVVNGDPLHLEVEATGTAPLSYQWEFNGAPIVGATARTFDLGSANPNHSGSYRVRVSNTAGFVLSRFAVVTVNGPGGTIQFSNASLRTPVTAEDGVTLLSGDGYLAQLYAGTSASGLQPVPGIVPFATGAAAGYWRGGVRSLPGLPPGSTASVQVRVWETSAGSTFEQALESGRPIGLSRVLDVTLGGVGIPPSFPATLSGLLPFSLSTQVAPMVTDGLEPAVVIAGQPLNLTVDAFGLEPLTFEWKRNGAVLPGFIGRTLQILSAQPGDAGDYLVTIRNGFGEAVSGPVAVLVIVPPSFTTLPQSLTVVAGAPAQFSVAAAGSAPLAFQWRRNGQNIAFANGPILQIPAAGPADAGEYTVQVSNAGGSIVSAPAAILNVVVPPSIVIEPADVNIPVGDTFSISVGAAGSAPLSYAWERNGESLAGQTGPSLNVAAATQEASGSYRVRISNPAGSVLSRFAVVTVNGPGGTIQFSNAGIRTPVTAEDGVTLLSGDGYFAQLYVGTTPATLQPVPGVVPFATGAAAGYWRGGVRAIPGFAPGSAALLQVRVWESAAGSSFEEALEAGQPVGLSRILSVTLGGVGVPPSFPATLAGLLPFSLTRNVAPQVTADLDPAVVIAGQPLNLTVDAFGLEPLTFEWKRNGAVLPAFTGRTLQIPSAQPADAGDYLVTIRNGFGEAVSGPVAVQVIVPPSFTTLPQSLTVVAGAPAQFSVEAAGSAPLAFQWLRNGQNIAFANGPILQIPAAGPADAGEYTVQVSNAGGSIVSAPAAILNVVVPPSIVTQPSDLTVLAGQLAGVAVEAEGTGPLQYQWELNGRNIPGATGLEFSVTAAGAEVSGSYRVRVSNAAGSVLSRFAVVVVTPPGGSVQFSSANLRVPVFAADGTTLIEGDGYLAQLYAGTSPDSLQPVAGAVPFATGAAAGFWRGGVRNIPFIAAGSPAFLQVRVWETAAGPTFHEALAAGRPVGISSAIAATLGGVGVPPSFPATLAGILPFQMQLWTAPAIVSSPTPADVVLGSELRLTVNAVGTAPLRFVWTRNGSLLPETGPTLVIPAVAAGDSGLYAVTAANWVGVAVAEPAQVNVLTPPRITTQPQGLTAVAGAAAQFEVSASGSEPLSYQWRRDGSDIPGAQSRTLLIPSAQIGDAGTYSVFVSNAAGSETSQDASLTVLAQPFFITQPGSVNLAAGATLDLSTEIGGAAPIFLQWQKNGASVPGATNRTLRIFATTADHSGTYRLVATNPYGQAISDTAIVVVTGAGGTVQFSNVALRAPVADTDGTTLLAGPGHLAQLYAGASADTLKAVPGATTFGTGAAAGYWIGGVRSIPDLAPGTTAFLQVRVWELAAGPTFESAVSAGHPVGISALVSGVLGNLGTPPSLPIALNGLLPFTLQQWTPPQISLQPPPTSVILGQPLTLSAGVSGSGPLAIAWFRGETRIPDASGTALFLPAATLADAGEYRLTAVNWVGATTSAPALVTVLVPPSITVAPQPLTIAAGQTVRFEVEATGTGPLAFQWLKNGSSIPGAVARVLEKPNATPPDSGDYSVRITGPGGSIVSTPVTLVVIGLPQITANPIPLTRIAGETAELSVQATGIGPLTYAWYRNDAVIPGASSPSLPLPSLLVTDAATYRARISNFAGFVDSLPATLTVVTRPTLIEAPGSVVATAGEAVHFNVVADGTGPLDYQWFRNGTAIPGALTPTHSIPSVSTADAARYSVRIRNPYGEVTTPEATLDVDEPIELAGVAIDGYIVGATVFFDANRNGNQDPGEPFAVTDDLGRFDLDIPLGRFDTNKNGRIDAAEGRLVRLGGVDISTGLVSDIPAIGPVGSEVLGPLSSLVDALQSGNSALSVEDAEAIVARSLGLPKGTAVTQVDPIAAAADGDPAAAALLSAAAQVQDTLIQITSIIDSAAGGSVTAPESVLNVLAEALLDAEPIDLTEPRVILDLVNSSVDREGLEFSEEFSDAVSEVIAGGNQAKEDAAESGDPLEIAELIARIQTVVQGSTTEDLSDAAAGLQSETEVLARNTGDNFDKQVEEAPSGDLLGTETRPGTFSISQESPRLSENGLVITPLTLLRNDGNAGLVRVTLSLASGTATTPSDYGVSEMFVDFADGELVKTVDLASLIVDDNTPEPEESFHVTLRVAPGSPAGAVTGTRTMTTVVVDDDDRAGTFAFSAPQLEINEDGTVVRRLFVERSGGLNGSVRVVVSSTPVPGGAVPGLEYSPAQIILDFTPDQRLAQVVVPVFDDTLFEATEAADLTLAIANPSAAGATVGARSSAQLLIANNDARIPRIGFIGRPGDEIARARLRLTGPAGQRVGIEISTDLLNWTLSDDVVIGEDGTRELPIDLGRLDGYFFRFGPKR